MNIKMNPVEAHTLASLKLKTPTPHAPTHFVTSTRTSLFEGCADLHCHQYYVHCDAVADDAWPDFGRACFQSRIASFDAFHVSIFSVDEIRQLIGAFNATMSSTPGTDFMLPCLTTSVRPHRKPISALLRACCDDDSLGDVLQSCCLVEYDKYHFLDKHRDDDPLLFRPYLDMSIYLIQFAQQARCGLKPSTSTAGRPRCRSLLMASCLQASGDDLLSH